MKPSLHKLITDRIYYWTDRNLDEWITRGQAEELAEQIIKIVRDYHLVEDSNDNTL